MNAKRANIRRWLPVILALALAASTVQPAMRADVQAVETDNANEKTYTFDDENFYNAVNVMLSSRSANKGAKVEQDDDNKTLIINTEKLTEIYLSRKNLTAGNSQEILETLVRDCPNLSEFKMNGCTLDGFDFSVLNTRADSLKVIYLGLSSLREVPDWRLPNLESLDLFKGDLSAAGACANITTERFPKLIKLYLDRCEISNLDFLEHVGKLESLSLGNNKLRDESLQTLIDRSWDNLSDLTFLNIGMQERDMDGNFGYVDAGSSNYYTDMEKLASLPNEFSKLTELELAKTRITSLRAFAGVRGDISINFSDNKITDFAGITDFTKFTLARQSYTIPGTFVEGETVDIPAGEIQTLLQRILDKNDPLHGKITCTGCSLSDDAKSLTIQTKPENGVKLEVENGELRSSKFTLSYKKIPSYSIPQGLKAKVGDTLNKVTLPEGFTWKDPHQVLTEKGTFTYKATYKAAFSQYVEVDNIDIPVTVESYVIEPTPTVKPTPVPATPVPTPNVPTLAPDVPTPVPNAPTSAPNIPTATPNVPTAAPNEPTAIPNEPTATPNEPTPTPSAPAPTPLPSTSAPEAPTTTPLAPTPTPNIPTAEPQTPVPTPPVSAVTPAPSGPATPTPKPDESNLTGNQIENRTDLSLLLATGKQKGRGVRLTWRKWTGCTGYEVYCSFCDGKRNYKKLKTVTSTGKRVADHKNLKKNRAYKYYVVTYEIKDGRKHYLAKSPIIHVAMNKEPRTNAKSIKLNKKQVTLKKSKTFQIRAVAKKENKKKKLLAHEETFRYYVDDKRVVSLSKKGRIRAKQKGVCTVFVIANNGVAGKIKVIVK